MKLKKWNNDTIDRREEMDKWMGWEGWEGDIYVPGNAMTQTFVHEGHGGDE